MGQFWKLAYLGMKLGNWPKFQKLRIYSLYMPRGRNWGYYSFTCSGFSDMGRYSKLPYLGTKHGHCQKFQKLHICSLSTPGVEIELIFALWAVVCKIWAYFQNCNIWAWNLATGKSSRNYTCLSFYPKGLKLSQFLLYGQRFQRYGPIFKIAIFGHETWQFAKLLEVAHIPLKLLPSPKVHSVLLYDHSFSDNSGFVLVSL